MRTKIVPVNETKMLSLMALLSKYDLFHISTDDGQDFNATEIVNKEFGIIEFKRLFATPVYTDDTVTDIQAIAADEFLCQIPNKTYKIKALHTKPQNICVHEHKTWNNVSDLMDTSYFSDRFITYDNNTDMLIVAVDPWLLGDLSSKEKSQIKYILNAFLGGLSQSMQMSRTICFQVKKTEGFNKIFAGVYDLEHSRPVTCKLIYNDRDREIVSDEFYSKVQDFIKYVQGTCAKFS